MGSFETVNYFLVAILKIIIYAFKITYFAALDSVNHGFFDGKRTFTESRLHATLSGSKLLLTLSCTIIHSHFYLFIQFIFLILSKNGVYTEGSLLNPFRFHYTNYFSNSFFKKSNYDNHY
jgi:hypothetical protein